MEDRKRCLGLLGEAQVAGARMIPVCDVLGVSMRTVERWKRKPEDLRHGPKTKPSHALTDEERRHIIEAANSSEFANLPPCQIVPLLADRGEYIGSESSVYRVLRSKNLLTHRLRSHPRRHAKPEALVATGPNQIWSWDITYLRAGVKGIFYYLYLPMDIFSRKIVHWEVHERESPEHASRMIEMACQNEVIRKDQITLHSDNGGPMKGATMLATLQRLGVAASFSRPRVSDDNPYSESLFKTLKYCPGFPERGFGSIEEARVWVEKFVHWYNEIHLHSGMNWVTPASRHQNRDEAVLSKRRDVYEAARRKNPMRWSGETRDWSRSDRVALNPGRDKKLDRKKVFVQQAA